jgi:hypothetical protein
MAEAQGPYRYARGHAYAAAMAKRDHDTPNHKLWDVAGVGHDGDKMLTSSCGLAALFDLPGCTAERRLRRERAGDAAPRLLWKPRIRNHARVPRSRSSAG